MISVLHLLWIVPLTGALSAELEELRNQQNNEQFPNGKQLEE